MKHDGVSFTVNQHEKVAEQAVEINYANVNFYHIDVWKKNIRSCVIEMRRKSAGYMWKYK
ncbi:hypothetical protein FACS1894105_05510 [Clostridia bacterium]|nr:hypothetical protein FACS1894105_05510 [Clostridia bacterium]